MPSTDRRPSGGGGGATTPPAGLARKRALEISSMQTGAGGPSLMAVLIFGTLAFLLVFKAYDTHVAPHANRAAAQRVANGSRPFEAFNRLMSLPDVGPRNTPPWRNFQAKLAREVAAGDRKQAFDLVFYGDSITERWRGTEMDRPRKDAAAFEASFETLFGARRTALLAISGDRTGQLLWRLDHGETPARGHAPRAAVILIGTNDLGMVVRQNPSGDPTEAAPDAVRRLTAAVGLLRQQLPETHVLVAAVLPRGWKGKEKHRWPNRFTPGINFINEHMQTAAEGEANVTFVDCNQGFLRNGTIDKQLMPDSLHPSPVGMGLLGKCYIEELGRLGIMPPGD